MPILVLLGLIAAYLIWRAFGRRNQIAAPPGPGLFRRKPCRWDVTGGGTKNLAEYKCSYCKVTAYSGGGKPPVECKRRIGGSL